jgi:hypothetical protein
LPRDVLGHVLASPAGTHSVEVHQIWTMSRCSRCTATAAARSRSHTTR